MDFWTLHVISKMQISELNLKLLPGLATTQMSLII